MFADYVDDGPMWTGSGDREIRREIKFDGKFKSPPAVHVSMSLLDIDQSTNTRVEVVAEEKDAEPNVEDTTEQKDEEDKKEL